MSARGESLHSAQHGARKNTPKAGVTSLDKGLKANSDGSVDVYFGPKSPAGKRCNFNKFGWHLGNIS
jgi:hypothetical protein